MVQEYTIKDSVLPKIPVGDFWAPPRRNGAPPKNPAEPLQKKRKRKKREKSPPKHPNWPTPSFRQGDKGYFPAGQNHRH